MKKILLQLDTNERPSPFDAIVAYDAGVDIVLAHSGVGTDRRPRPRPVDAFFTRGPKDLSTLAVWVGGHDVGLGERVLAEAKKAFFGPFQVSVMVDSNGSNTTAATAVARLAKHRRPEGPQGGWSSGSARSACGRRCCWSARAAR